MTVAGWDSRGNSRGTKMILGHEEPEVSLWSLMEFLDQWPVYGVLTDDLRKLSCLELARQLLPKKFTLEATKFFPPVKPDPLEPYGKEKFTTTLSAQGLLELECHSPIKYRL